ncbi:MAG: class I SAM-dependent methyltransferase [Gammaproteobacteria bacterium]|nr:class I SAM-dependent methyltransferase [Gammaproteobacteria bacterium]
MKPFAESCEENKKPILEILREYFADVHQVLEIGSGTGQHAVYFSKKLPHLHWQPSDLKENLAGINTWLEEAKRTNISPPFELDVNQNPWPALNADAVFSANTAHIMDWPSVEKMFTGIGLILKPQGLFCLYGPFNFHGEFSSKSNEEFDQWLKLRNPDSGIRDIDDLVDLGCIHKLRLVQNYEMPVNNRLLVWQKVKIIELI